MKLSWRKKILLLVLSVFVPLLWSFSAEAAIQGIPGPTFTLTAKTGYIVTDDGNSVFMWGFANGNGVMQYPGPTLIVNQGDIVTINLTNTLSVPVSIVFPGQSGVTATGAGGIPGFLTTEVPPDNGATTVQYSFIAGDPGTYLYYSGTNPELQVEMGLVGALIVRPSMGVKYAYNQADSAFDREQLFLLSEIDPIIHELVNFGRMNEVDNTTAYPVYWFINGRSGLDTTAADFMPLMPSQPYGALVAMHPGDKVLVRMIGAGRQLHPLHLHGNYHRVIARDSRLLLGPAGQDLSYLAFTTAMGPGQTADALFTWTGEGNGWDLYGHAPTDPLQPGECPGPGGLLDPKCDHGKPIPVELPNVKDTTFGPFYSGSPFLGSAGVLPPGEGGFNPNAGLFFMWHSHSEKELTSNNIFPGGMLTFVVVEHPNVNIP